MKARLERLEAKFSPDSDTVEHHLISAILHDCISIWRMRGRELVEELPGCGHECRHALAAEARR
jgi:hypothetical protein